MAKPSSSFRRILLTRLLLLSVPVLLLGMFATSSVTYRKARSALLETARQNLTESAARKGEMMRMELSALKTNLATATKSSVFLENQLENYQPFLEQLSKQLPTEIQCLQLIEVETQNRAASTCGPRELKTPQTTAWPSSDRSLLLATERIQLQVLLPSTPSSQNSPELNQLQLCLHAPIYNRAGDLQYVLAVDTLVVQPNPTQRGSLAGASAIVDQKGTILMHPRRDRIGRNIAREYDGSRLERVLRNALAGQEDFLHLAFEPGKEYVVGYKAIPSPINPAEKWAVLAVASLNDALADLWGIQQTLLGLLVAVSVSLIGACFLAILYLARDLSRPLEKLRDYALDEDNLYSNDQVPQNLKIREFNELASAFNRMVKRLKAWAMELETAWKEAQAANQLKSEFLTTISHELRTPLNGIIGSIRLIEDGFCDDREEEMEFLEQADRAAVHLLSIIDDILDISKIESGQLTVTLEVVDFSQLLSEGIALYESALKEKGLTLLSPEAFPTYKVHADPDKLKQVFCNIIDNAIKFTKAGRIAVSVCVESRVPSLTVPRNDSESEKHHLTPSVKQVVATIEDTGIGIAPDQMDKLFRPFVMVDGSTTREAGGTGLGLALSRNFIELMGGSIVLTSSGKDRGTRVKIALPLLESSL